MNPEPLRKLAALLPERVRVYTITPADNPVIHDFWVYADQDWRGIMQSECERVWHGVRGRLWLENALREEIEIRGWDWDTAGGPQHQQCLGTVWIATPKRHHAFAPTPAEALALALIAALEGEA